MKFNKKMKSILVFTLILGTTFFSISPLLNVDDETPVLIDDTLTDDEIILTEPQSAAAFDPDVWWDYLWSYRVGINASGVGRYTSDSINFTNRLLEVGIDFTNLLEEQEDTGTFDENSIRIIEYDINGILIQECPSQFDKDSDYDADTKASGELSWVMNGTTLNDTKRIFFIYFDTIQNGAKSAPSYDFGYSITEKTENLDYTLENDKFKVSMGIYTSSYQAHVYELFNKHSGSEVEQHMSTYRWGWMSYSWNFGGGAPTGINTMAIVSDGPVKKTVKMVYDHANFLYERHYTINYLDDTIRIAYKVWAKNALAQGTWTYASWWNPGYGSSSYTLPDSAYGFGGHDWGGVLPISGLDSQYTNSQNIPSTQGWHATTSQIRDASWFAQWNLNGQGDPNKYDGVGTVWGNVMNNYTLNYGYYLNEGRYPYWQQRTPMTGAGGYFETYNWGVVFNNTEGDYVEERAPGLQDRPLLSSWGESQSAGKVLSLQAKDLDNNVLEGAEIEIRNSTMDLLQNQTTNSLGNVTFRGLLNDDHTITAYFWVNKTRFMIKNESLEINLPITKRQVFHTLESCNLTTINLLGSDKTTGYSLYQAYLTITNSTGGFIIKTPTDTMGWTQLMLPADTYNVSAIYQGSPYDITLNLTGKDTIYRPTYDFDLTEEARINVTLSITDDLTDLTIKSVDYGYINWNHDEKISTQPYSIGVYMNDTVNITVFYEKVADGSGIQPATDKFFELYKGADLKNDTNNDLRDEGNGNYSFLLYSYHYTPGSYSIKVNLSESGYQDAVRYIDFKIKNHTSSITQIDTTDLSVLWNENITLCVNYSTLLPEKIGMPGATVNWTILGTIHTGSLIDRGNGNYTLAFNTTNLDVGTYQLYVRANKTNVNLATKSFMLSVFQVPTSISWRVPEALDYEVTSTYVKMARGEKTSIIVNYSVSATGGYIGASTDVSASLLNQTNVADPFYPDSIQLDDLGDGEYNLTINASKYSAGEYEVSFVCTEDHHQDQIESIRLDILDKWPTTANVRENPTFKPWNNITSFTFYYNCTTEPRDARPLPGGIINTLTVYVDIGGTDQLYKVFGVADRNAGIWGYSDLGTGEYYVWLNTSYVNVSKSTSFTFSPRITLSLYADGVVSDAYSSVYPVYTELTPVSDKSEIIPVKNLAFYLDQSSMITLYYNVSDRSSVIDNTRIPNATVTYIITKNDVNRTYISNGTVSAINNVLYPGVYRHNLLANRLGSFIITFLAVKENFSASSVSISYIVGLKPINYTFGANVRNKIISTPQNRPISFTINLNDTVHDNEPLSGATITIEILNEFDNKTYTFTEDPDNPGVYVITINETMLAVLPPGSYSMIITILKENYEVTEVEMFIDIGLPVDPFLGIPYLYWAIILATVAVVLGIYGATKYVQYSRIPAILKDINSMRKKISKSKSLPEGIGTETYDEQLIDRINSYWKDIDLDLKGKVKEGRQIPEEIVKEPTSDGGISKDNDSRGGDA